MPADHADAKYTKQALRKRLKRPIQASSKGGRSGEWSARKSQRLLQEYEHHGGDCRRNGSRDEAKSLHAWTNEDWQAKDGGKAGNVPTTKRYLPKRAWDLLTEPQKLGRVDNHLRRTVTDAKCQKAK